MDWWIDWLIDSHIALAPMGTRASHLHFKNIKIEIRICYECISSSGHTYGKGSTACAPPSRFPCRLHPTMKSRKKQILQLYMPILSVMLQSKKITGINDSQQALTSLCQIQARPEIKRLRQNCSREIPKIQKKSLSFSKIRNLTMRTFLKNKKHWTFLLNQSFFDFWFFFDFFSKIFFFNVFKKKIFNFFIKLDLYYLQ